MDINFYVGLAGALILVTGAAWPVKKVKHPMKSTKNWLFAIGGGVMLTYSILGYLAGGAVFFIFLQSLVVIASVLMMLNTKEKISIPAIIISGIALIIWSLYLFEGYNTVFFIIGLTGVGLGYILKMGSIRRNVALMLGGLLIAIFSYIEMSWIFFWLNAFFAAFSAYYVVKLALVKKKS
ncbi:hypothetical protein ACFL3T_02615 [Patescibacteria group bacterium]